MSKIIQFPKSKSIPETEVGEEPSPATFKDFFFQNMMGDLNAAAKTLESLFEIDGYTARQYAIKYNTKSLNDPSITMKTLEIKNAIDSNNKNEAITLIQYCFDLSVVESIMILTALMKYNK